MSWFNAGADALARVLPDVPRGYACPLCLRLFPPELAHQLTREDVPPQARGGRKIVLTCWECNNGAGPTLNAAADLHESMIDFMRGTMTKPLTVRMTMEDLCLNAEVIADGRNVLVKGIRGRNPPGTADGWKQAFRTAGSGEGGRNEIRLTFSDGYRLKEALADWLRSAYLAAFAVFGYTYVLSPPLEVVRQQIAHPEQHLIRIFSLTEPSSSSAGRHIVILREPERLRSLVVVMGRHVVFLPWGSNDVYAALAEDAAGAVHMTVPFPDEEIRWPTGATFAMDLQRIR